MRYSDGYTVTENGTYTFCVTNGYGLTAEGSITYDKIDNVKPVVAIDSHGYTDNSWVNEDVILSVSNTAENLSTVTFQYKVDSGDWQNYSHSINITGATNNTTYTFKAISASGVESAEASIVVKIPDLTAQNLVITRLHSKGILNAAEYTAQSDALENRITEMRIERRTKITDSDENKILDELKALNDILEETEISAGFNSELFEQTVDSITVDSSEQLTFHLTGGISLPKKIREKGRCYRR